MKYSIVVNTCDSYSDCWEPFFKLFSVFWKDCKGEIFLNTEYKDYSFPGLDIIPTKVCEKRNFPKDKRMPWYKEHAKNLFDILSGTADYVFLFYGDNSDSENSEIRKNLKKVPNEKSIILIATGQKIGEGFDFPRLDTLMLASPVSFDGRLEQYVGRLHRDYEGKKYVVVYDYIDAHLKVFEKMYLKRLRTYKRLGYSLISNRTLDKQVANAM